MLVVIDRVVAPFGSQKYVTPGDAVSVTVAEEPQRLVDPVAVIAGVTGVLTVTATGVLVSEQPAGSVTVTLYDPDCVALMFAVVAPFDQRNE
jgi:hypothetical protein